MEAICRDPTVSVASVPSNKNPAESRSLITESGFQIISNAEEVVLMEVEAADGIPNLDDLQLMKVDIAVWQANTTKENAGKLVPVRKFNFENYEFVEIFANLDPSTKGCINCGRTLESRRKGSEFSLNEMDLITLGGSSLLHLSPH